MKNPDSTYKINVPPQGPGCLERFWACMRSCVPAPEPDKIFLTTKNFTSIVTEEAKLATSKATDAKQNLFQHWSCALNTLSQ